MWFQMSPFWLKLLQILKALQWHRGGATFLCEHINVSPWQLLTSGTDSTISFTENQSTHLQSHLSVVYEETCLVCTYCLAENASFTHSFWADGYNKWIIWLDRCKMITANASEAKNEKLLMDIIGTSCHTIHSGRVWKEYGGAGGPNAATLGPFVYEM